MRRLALVALAWAALGAAPAAAELRLGTTTSTDDSGLLRVVLPRFESATGIKVRVLSAGTGRALRMAQNGEVDLVLVHSRADEDRFVAEGWGVQRRDVMYNDFIIVGPVSDPARIRGGNNAVNAMRRILDSGSPFVSRADESGTHVRERELWQKVGRMPPPRQYVTAVDGMGAVLVESSNLRAYTLSDRATFGAYRTRISLEPMVEGDPALYNPYGVIAVNPARHPQAQYRDAMRLIEWLTGAEGRRAIAGFRVNGQQLFFPLSR